MSLPRVYLETSFISYLAAALQQRHSSDVNTAHRQLSSLRWWADRDHFELLFQKLFPESALPDTLSLRGTAFSFLPLLVFFLKFKRY